ncbi:protein O-mannosyl-transferase Tmtc3 [Trichonephila clavipes]|uniref:Protein O-mannosyl-transferase Tmtc3 n=1 Tax=Trichonephila clavipes TaxID=2585209 RepID=A0A8X6RFB9_TRICX|nr:protein O-mannosyl-transferase Tmtc3 [Trichonephila clavipes]
MNFLCRALPLLDKQNQHVSQHHPDHVKGLILLGDIYINTIRDLDAAQECYENILRQEPHNVQALHNLCVVHVERGVLKEAEECLERASAMAPNERYITDHLEIVRQRRKLTTRTSAPKDKTVPDPKDKR